MWQVDGKGESDIQFGPQEWGSDLVGCEAVFVAEGYLRHLNIRQDHLYLWGLRCYCGNCWWWLGRLTNWVGKDVS